MLNIIRNASIYLLRNKEFVKFITIMPTVLFLLMTMLLPYSVDLTQRSRTTGQPIIRQYRPA